jgi:hypothetical protein
MTAANILLYVALIGFMIFQRVKGRPVQSLRPLLALPVILSIIGWQDIAHVHPFSPIDITVSVIGCALSLVLGAVRGFADKISERNGVPWVQWSVTSLVVFAINVVAKLGLDAAGVALGGTSKAVASSLLLAVGLMLIGESLVILYRIHGSEPRRADGPNIGSSGGATSGGGLLGGGLLGGGGLLRRDGLLGGEGGLLVGNRGGSQDDELDRRRSGRDRHRGPR